MSGGPGFPWQNRRRRRSDHAQPRFLNNPSVLSDTVTGSGRQARCRITGGRYNFYPSSDESVLDLDENLGVAAVLFLRWRKSPDASATVTSRRSSPSLIQRQPAAGLETEESGFPLGDPLGVSAVLLSLWTLTIGTLVDCNLLWPRVTFSSIFLVPSRDPDHEVGKFSIKPEEGASWKSLLAYEMWREGPLYPFHRGVPIGRSSCAT